MSIMTDPLTLSKDIHFVPVAELPEHVQDKIDWTEGDVAITRRQSRTPSKVINADLATLLDLFRSDRTIVEAVMHYGLQSATNPHDVLENVFPTLQQFVQQGFLVPPHLTDRPITHSLERGDQLNEFTIIRRIRALEDTEIYMAKATDGTFVAIKIAQPHANSIVATVLEHEAEILRKLQGGDVRVPGFIDQGEWQERPWIAIEWCQGSDVLTVAKELREQPNKLLALCIAILDAYSLLHRHGVFHGDIHPGNILVSGDNEITLIDFGIAHSLSLPAPYRGGVAFYYEPEYAQAYMHKQPLPNATALGEQYALASLFYQTFTGATYLDFSLEEEVLYRQIAEDSPIPFSERGIDPWSTVEASLKKALQKDSGQRYETLEMFAKALRDVPALNPPISTKREQGQGFVDNILRKLQVGGILLEEGLPRSPFASVNYGAAGIAYALYRIACTRNNPELLALADAWLFKAEIALSQDGAFYNPELDMNETQIGLISPYHTPSGVFATRFFISRAMGEGYSQAQALFNYVQSISQPCENLDITLGKAGVLLTNATFFEGLQDKSWGEQSGLVKAGNTIHMELGEFIEESVPIGPNNQLTNLGIAHGWAGVLYAVLRWHQAIGAPLPLSLQTRLNQLANCAEPNGRGLSWLWDYDQTETVMPGWCNGSAGYVHLWELASQILEDTGYRQLAIDAGRHVWEDISTASSLCCGLTGRSYSLIRLYQITNDEVWLNRAHTLAERALYHTQYTQLPEYVGFEMSLYKGELGVALLTVDLEQPDQAIFPFFGSEWAL